MEIYDKKQEAITLHTEILAKAEFVAHSMIELAKSLKKMRDSKLYTQLGFEKFEDYTEKMVGIKQRQAYNFISALEGFGEDKFEKYSSLGITKLNALLSVPYEIRDEFIEKNNVSNVSTRDLSTMIKELEEKGEQISLYEEQMAIGTSQNDDLKQMLKNAQSEKQSLLQEISILKNKPIEVSPPSAADLEKIKTEVKVELDKDYQKQTADLKQNHQNQLDEIQKQKQVDLEKAQKLVKENSLTSDPAIVEMMVYFNELQELCEKLKKTSFSINDTEKRSKVIGVVNDFIREIEID